MTPFKKIKSGDFVKLSYGFTYFEKNNLNNDEIAVFIHGFSVPSTYGMKHTTSRLKGA